MLTASATAAPKPLRDARITERGGIVYGCPSCGRDHSHGLAGEKVGQRTHRTTHCHLETGGVVLRIVADARKAAA